MSIPPPAAPQDDAVASEPSPASGTAAVSAGDEESLPPRALRRPRQTKHWYRLALGFTLILIVGVVIALPLAVRSMYGTLFVTTDSPYFDLETGLVLTADEIEENEPDQTYMNIAITDVAEDTGSVSLTISGHRACSGVCPELDLLLLSLDNSTARRGLAPSAELQVLEAVDAFTEDVALPISGNPSLYPFDHYTIDLAVAGFAIDPAGTPTPLTPSSFDDNLNVAVQNQITGLIMADPADFELPRIEQKDELLTPVAARELVFTRPIYLQILTALLVLLIGISGLLALLTRSIDDLLLGIGGLILGVWGIRSVMVPQPLPTLSVVDISLSGVILLLLIGLAIRTAIHFHEKSELQLMERWLKRGSAGPDAGG